MVVRAGAHRALVHWRQRVPGGRNQKKKTNNPFVATVITCGPERAELNRIVLLVGDTPNPARNKSRSASRVSSVNQGCSTTGCWPGARAWELGLRAFGCRETRRGASQGNELHANGIDENPTPVFKDGYLTLPDGLANIGRGDPEGLHRHQLKRFRQD